MDCDNLRTRVAPLLDGELGPAEEQLLGQHIEACRACAVFVERIAAQELAPPEPDPRTSAPGFWLRLDDAIEAERQRGPSVGQAAGPPLWQRKLTVGAPALMVAAACSLLSIGFGAWSLSQAADARAQTALLSQELDRERRLAASPASPVQVDAFRLATYTPHRGTF